jgi:hypothetical protein
MIGDARNLVLLLATASAPAGQQNANPNIDVALGGLRDLRPLGRVGAFGSGTSGCAMETTSCNFGSEAVPWEMAMDPDHPFIAFLVARESGGRFEQISDRSYVKHGFFAFSGNVCSPNCQGTSGTSLGVGCSDTYATQNNGDLFWLGPPDEVDPWLGAWDPVCSHFDRGEPPVAPPGDCNGQRSLSLSQVIQLGDVSHRVRVRDAEFATPGSFWYQGQYVVAAEPEANRGNNLGSRGFTPVQNGNRWDLVEGEPLLYGSILQRWSGSTLESGTNGLDDGRVYVATKVSGPVEGFYHYEIAVHNRDNARGIGALRIPLCGGARVRALGFGDIDTNTANDWTASVGSTELVFSGPSNALKWNSVFNFWFDCDAAPESGTFTLDQALPGAGSAALAIAGRAPLGLYALVSGPGCARDTPPTLFAAGNPPRALLGNAGFEVHSSGNAPLQPSFLYFSRQGGPFGFQGCSVWMGPAHVLVSLVQSDAAGLAVHATPIPNNLALEGLDAYLQIVGRDPGNGILVRDFELSDGLRVRTGNALGGCP